MKKTGFILLAVAVLTLPMLSLSDVFADRGDRHMGSYYGHMGGWGDLSEKDQARLDTERTAFFKETKDLRTRIDDKEWELGRELRADKPSEKKVIALQRELSNLRGQMDQKTLAYRLKVRAMFPDAEGYAGGYGHGMMNGGGRGGCSW